MDESEGGFYCKIIGKDGIMKPPIDWLLSASPWTEYRTRRDLLGLPESDPAVAAARQAMLAHPLVKGLVNDLADWPLPLLNSHKSAGHPLHKLAFLADLGLRRGDLGMETVISRVLAHQSAQGPFQMMGNISTAYGGSGKDEYAWALCDAPLVTFSLVRLGLADDPRVQMSVRHLAGLVRGNGWPCAVSPELGKWRGPGKKDDPCPYANLVMLKLLAELPDGHDSPPVRAGVETALSLWTGSLSRHPYMFFMGTDFRKLKAPLVWYDLLHFLDVLTRFEWVRKDPRLLEMTALLASKADAEGRFLPESVWMVYKDWDFGQKKVPSAWSTLLAWRVLERAGK
jgi:hypothetical protein